MCASIFRIFFSFSKDLLFKAKLPRNGGFTRTQKLRKGSISEPPPHTHTHIRCWVWCQRLHSRAFRSSSSQFTDSQWPPFLHIAPTAWCRSACLPWWLRSRGCPSAHLADIKMLFCPLHLDKRMCMTFQPQANGFWKTSLIQARSKGLLSRTPGCSLRMSFLESPEILRHGFPVSWGDDSQLGKRCWQNHTDCLSLGKASGEERAKSDMQSLERYSGAYAAA